RVAHAEEMADHVRLLLALERGDGGHDQPVCLADHHLRLEFGAGAVCLVDRPDQRGDLVEDGGRLVEQLTQVRRRGGPAGRPPRATRRQSSKSVCSARARRTGYATIQSSLPQPVSGPPRSFQPMSTDAPSRSTVTWPCCTSAGAQETVLPFRCAEPSRMQSNG